MGTNYYLEKRDQSGWVLPSSQLSESIDRLVYKEINNEAKTLSLDLEKCTTRVDGLHIGKDSTNWYFILCIYPFLDIYNLSDWTKMFDSDLYVIKDEYGQEISKDEMIQIITCKVNPYYMEALKEHKSYEEYEQEFVDRYNVQEEELAEKFHNTPEYCKDYMDILDRNHASIGLWGLWKHCSSIWDQRDNKCWSGFMPIISQYISTNGTYDLTLNWDFC